MPPKAPIIMIGINKPRGMNGRIVFFKRMIRKRDDISHQLPVPFPNNHLIVVVLLWLTSLLFQLRNEYDGHDKFRRTKRMSAAGGRRRVESDWIIIKKKLQI